MGLKITPPLNKNPGLFISEIFEKNKNPRVFFPRSKSEKNKNPRSFFLREARKFSEKRSDLQGKTNRKV